MPGSVGRPSEYYTGAPVSTCASWKVWMLSWLHPSGTRKSGNVLTLDSACEVLCPNSNLPSIAVISRVMLIRKVWGVLMSDLELSEKEDVGCATKCSFSLPCITDNLGESHFKVQI